MWGFTLFLALAALVFAADRLRAHRRAVRALRDALRDRRLLLREDMPGTLGADWDELCVAAGEQAAELERLRHRQSGQSSQLEAALGSLQEAVLLLDEGNRVLLANPACHAMFPRAGVILGERVERVVRGDAFLRLIEAVRRGEAPPRQEIEVSETDGTIWLEATGALVASEDSARRFGVLFVLHDVTRQKRLENVRRDFVANVSHELRTPLAVIRGYVETLLDDHDAMPAADRTRFLTTVQRHAERLNRLLDDLLVLSRLESARPGLAQERVEPSGWLSAAIEECRAQPFAAHHRLVGQVEAGLPTVNGDAFKLGQVLENLLTNACKYTPPGSTVEIGARLAGGEVEVWVADDGPGIPAADLPHVFERFYRVDKGRSRETGGTGLGLSIVKHIVQLHGGRVWAESRLGEGAVFRFTLPVAKVLAGGAAS